MFKFVFSSKSVVWILLLLLLLLLPMLPLPLVLLPLLLLLCLSLLHHLQGTDPVTRIEIVTETESAIGRSVNSLDHHGTWGW